VGVVAGAEDVVVGVVVGAELTSPPSFSISA